MQGLFLRRKPCKSRIFVNKITVLLTFSQMQNSNFIASKNDTEACPITIAIQWDFPITYEMARAYQKANGKYLRQNQWEDITLVMSLELGK